MLYFETFTEDELRRNDLSKNNKSHQPQILVALMVTKEGLPIVYEVFCANAFEGHTFIPVIKKFVNTNKVNDFNAIAGAAMISRENIELLIQNNINYIVGARPGNLSHTFINQISNGMNREDGETIRIKTELGYLICSYSQLRYRKDKYEMKKQVERAKYIIGNPSKNRRIKFTRSDGKKLLLNQALDKTKKLLGIKGYYTNVVEQFVSNKVIIDRYHELYRIE